MDAFDTIWDTLAEQGSCDARGGMEYTRIRKVWDTEGEMMAVYRFILHEASQPIQLTPPPPHKPMPDNS